MEIYENDNEQVDAVKRFFAENGGSGRGSGYWRTGWLALLE